MHAKSVGTSVACHGVMSVDTSVACHGVACQLTRMIYRKVKDGVIGDTTLVGSGVQCDKDVQHCVLGTRPFSRSMRNLLSSRGAAM